MSTRLKLGLLFSLLTVFMTVTITVIHSQQKQGNTPSKKSANDEVVPVVDFNKHLPSDEKEKYKRLKKNKNRNLELGPKTGVFDSSLFMLNEERESGYGGFESHSPAEPGIPGASSDVIVLGDVSGAEAFLSEDKVSIYSEFTINVVDVLKNNPSRGIVPGASITVSRGGGGVRFQSGKIIKKVFEGKPLPRVSSRYVFFLRNDEQNEDYTIITAYEIKDGKIIPLDGLDRNGRVIYQLASHQSYLGISEAAFLETVRSAISSSADLFDKEGQ